ncbi:Leucine-rich repeat-containing protein 15 [Pseudolycoriella hygida]|uniref:Leucine-rich repeat-containing protein 15 n=1 Tax=Pseudolycoriella hygida TaxID=35572 RepID=A0A9Q0RWC3_9DIPT|nr:Leucine-rich repeat-containing protein 15 [Pseudolycoriella hygida]
MLCQRIGWVFVAVLCAMTFHIVGSIEVTCYNNDDSKCVFEQDIMWDGMEEFVIKNSDEQADSTTEIILQAPFKTKFIPTEIFRKFANLKSLTIMEVGLDTISSDDFVNAKNLQYLHVRKNNIAVLKSSSFVAATNLLELDLSDNQITQIEEDAFNGLNEMTKLNLFANKVKDLNLAIFTKFPKLKYLVIAYADFIFSVPYDPEEAAKLVMLNSSVTILDLSNNYINSTDLWRHLSIFPNLETVYLMSNKVTHVDHMEEFKRLLPYLTEIIMYTNPLDVDWKEGAKTFFDRLQIDFKYDF